ncbi:hypothetical protein ABZ883_03035 [Streptomyces sp. NPDC046977]|uniref:hypothetical protein n=1 Tax=Streptomyces sp. NPDC046977 TaxID=3154703 RepID=UPI0033CA908F
MQDRTVHPHTPSSIPSDARALLQAIRDALDIPLPSIEPADVESYQRLMERRATHVLSMLDGILTVPAGGLDRDAALIQRHTDATPVTYQVWRPQSPGEVSAP